jgi:hypothetical protein
MEKGLNLMKTKLLLGSLLLVATSGLVTGCQTVATGTGGGGVYIQAWYDVYGNHCGNGTPGPGCNFYSDGYKITAGEDPFSSNGYMLNYNTYLYTDSYGYSQQYTGYGWVSTDGILYDDLGYALNSGEDRDSRDMIGDVAAAEQAVVSKAGKDFAAKYALSEDAGVSIARTLNDWATLSKKEKRARTEQDVADFSKRLYGVSVDKAQAALDAAKKGDQSGVLQINTDVATYWGTSPETSKAILKTWYKDQLAEAGVK